MLRFGTDGIRGDADADLTSPLVFALGRAAARVLGTDRPFLVGRDTRASGPRIEAALAAGLAHEGAATLSAGVLPTPGVAYLSQRDGVPAAVVSASHNRWSDNGVKLFAAGGRKLADETESAVEQALRTCLGDPRPVPALVVEGLSGAADGYCDHLVSVLDGGRLDGMRVVVDCANGAAAEVAPRVLEALGADVEALNAAPDGMNINEECGSTHPASLQRTVLARGAAAGLAFDGDADRVLAVDENGVLVDGDQIMLIAALDLHARGMLRGEAIAVTVMSNLGLRRALEAAGIGVVETPVGDRHVLAALEERELVLGGEQSGHVVFRDLATTGDGLLTGLLLLDRVSRAGRPLSALAAAMTRFPQVLESVRVASREVERADTLVAEVAAVEAELGHAGRVLVRASGTEPVVRIMVEAETEEIARVAVDRLRRVAFDALGGPDAEGSNGP